MVDSEASETRPRLASIAVIGGGRMGTAIAYVFAATGHEVALYDSSSESLDGARQELVRIAALLGRQPARGVSFNETLAEAVRGVAIVIEAVTEELVIKQELFSQLSDLADPQAILATNTSATPIHMIAAAAEHPDRVIGTHFWNPAYAVELVEVVQSVHTSIEVVEKTMDILQGAGLAPVHLKRDVPGFVGNRLQHALKREAIALVASGVCDAETVDTVVKLGFGRRLAVLGPLEQSDLVGLDLTLAIHETLMPDLDVTPVPHPLLVEKVRRGDLGVKTGRGFYDWTTEKARVLQGRLERHLLGTPEPPEEPGGPT